MHFTFENYTNINDIFQIQLMDKSGAMLFSLYGTHPTVFLKQCLSLPLVSELKEGRDLEEGVADNSA